ncbi:hypothetical protein GSI_08416 [Ganoderma sinense ZZ0214-1]|uniref:Uncharacterized protein n=1 Tax=Ganoderma sinense ZZ0214-1 TaxID=1077348 RepID=A0A2G8S6V1_9APHY|nr:hypothetical protein GSI_08416 [Ganoderma sinense ZZ0214-1]
MSLRVSAGTNSDTGSLEGSPVEGNPIPKGSSSSEPTPEPLDDSQYLTVLQTAFPEEELARNLELGKALKSTLSNIAVLFGPISPAALEALTKEPPKDVIRDVLSRLQPVVAYDADPEQPNAKFRLRHATFPEFLVRVDAKRCKSRPYQAGHPARQHSRLATRCLEALVTLKKNMCRLPDPTVPKAEVPNLEGLLEENVPEHVQYACACWAAHLGLGCYMKKKTNTPEFDCYCWDIGKPLEDFSSGSGTPTKLRAWVETMAYMGRLDTVGEALCVAQQHVKDGLGYEEVKSQLAATEKLVADHYSEIEACPYKIHMV